MVIKNNQVLFWLLQQIDFVHNCLLVFEKLSLVFFFFFLQQNCLQKWIVFFRYKNSFFYHELNNFIKRNCSTKWSVNLSSKKIVWKKKHFFLERFTKRFLQLILSFFVVVVVIFEVLRSRIGTEVFLLSAEMIYELSYDEAKKPTFICLFFFL